MSSNTKIAGRLHDMVRQYNRKLAADAMLQLVLGIAFCSLTFGFVFWVAWFSSSLFLRNLGLHAWQFGAVFSGLFIVVAVWSAWSRVDPLADLKPLSEREQMHRLVSLAVGLTYFSPRHATAGAAVMLLGGPASIFQALGIWAHRLRANDAIIAEASSLLAASDPQCPIEKIHEIASAVLLKRLGLIKVVPNGESHALTLTEKGRKILENRAK